jgi:hypothetical protein
VDGWYLDPDDLDDAVAAVRRLLATPAGEVDAVLDRAKQAAGRLTWRSNAERVAVAIEQVIRSRRNSPRAVR